ncbi:Rrf2 family transcriptional regulator [Erwinia sp. ACCC 02193]|uniref:Rrf2 family transcriptional regulator n=1 Tax=Erwinia aeris TaxID=3239803 RepID=A0ABV4E2E3_9GAMM
MKVIIFAKGTEIWARDTLSKENRLSLSFLKDGTQQQIIAALEESLTQARAQKDLSYDVDGVANISPVTSG